MIRLFVTQDLSENTQIEPDVKQAHYLTHVMRLKDKEIVTVFNGRDGEWLAEIQTVSKKKTMLLVQSQSASQMYRKTCILCPAIIKKENMDLVLQKATELGATAIYPMITQRTVVRGFNVERALAIVREACEQCERNDVPVIHEPVPLEDILDMFTSEITLVHLAERATDTTLLDKTCKPAFLIGPEGGFTDTENAQIARYPSVKRVHLGTTVLRAETAAIGVLAAWQFRLI